MKTILLILSCVIWYTSATPNPCCTNNGAVYRFQCLNGSSLWVNKACHFDAYTINDDEYKINADDTLTLIPDGEIVEKDEYCLTTMEDENIAMICFPDAAETHESQITAVGIIVCCSISIISLILTLFVYLVVPNLRDIQGKCMMFTIFSLLMSFTFLAVLQGPVTISLSSCSGLAFTVYFWFMSTFFWLNIVSFNVWRSVVRPRILSFKSSLLLVYNIYGWGAPTLLLVILLICNHTDGSHIKPNIGHTKCWFHDSDGVRAYFYGPICALLILNILMFISTAWTLSKQTKNATERKYRSHKYKMYLYLKLFIVMGICWVFEPMSEFLKEEETYFWLVTDYINGLQGLIIFLLLVVFRKRVRRDLARRGGLLFRGFPKEWATVADEECEELEEDVDELSCENATPVVVQTPSLNI